METPKTFKTICEKSMKPVTVTVSKTKVLDVPAHMGIQTKLGGVCPTCGQLHTTVITDNSANKYAPVYPVNQRAFLAPVDAELCDPQREDAL